MNFLFISKEGSSLPMALRVKMEGNTVAIYLDDPLLAKKAYEGLAVRKINRKELGALVEDRSWIKIFDETGMGKLADKLMRKDHLVVGGAGIADKLENDRDFGMQIMRKYDIRVPITQKFDNFAEAKKFVMENPRKYVFKPSTISEQKITSFEIQEYIPGVIIETEGWFTGNDFLYPLIGEMEEKYYANDNLGVMTGQAGTVLWAYEEASPAVVEKGIGKLLPLLRKEHYYGPICLNTIARGDELIGLEFTVRFGYDSVYAFMEGLEMDFGELLHGLADGKLKHISYNMATYQTALRVSVPPYPYNQISASTYVAQDIGDMINHLDHMTSRPVFQNDVNYTWLNYRDGHREMGTDIEGKKILLTSPEGLKIGGVKSEDLPHVHFFDVKADKNGNPVTAGTDGIICAITNKDTTIEAAMGRTYGIANSITIPNKFFRTDIGKRAVRDYQSLKEGNWFK